MSIAIEDAHKKFQRFMFRIWEIFIESIERYTVKCANFENFLKIRHNVTFSTILAWMTLIQNLLTLILRGGGGKYAPQFFKRLYL